MNGESPRNGEKPKTKKPTTAKRLEDIEKRLDDIQYYNQVIVTGAKLVYKEVKGISKTIEAEPKKNTKLSIVNLIVTSAIGIIVALLTVFVSPYITANASKVVELPQIQVITPEGKYRAMRRPA